MTIASLDNYIASAKQKITLCKTAARTTIANAWFSLFELAGNPGAGTLAGTSTTAGVVPDDTTAGFPGVNAFGGSALGYLSRIEFANTVPCRFSVYDLLWKAGAYAFNASATVTAPPSYSGRLPNTDYSGLEIWIECVTAFTGNLSVAVTYTNQAGTTAHTTGTFASGSALTVGRMMQLPLAAGDTGVQKIESVTATVASAGTFNVYVMRPLWSGRIPVANGGDVHDMLRTGLPRVYDTSALLFIINADSTSSGVPELELEIANN